MVGRVLHCIAGEFVAVFCVERELVPYATNEEPTKADASKLRACAKIFERPGASWMAFLRRGRFSESVNETVHLCAVAGFGGWCRILNVSVLHFFF